MLHDRTHHLAQRWITYRRRWAVGDFFFSPYSAVAPRTGFHNKGQVVRAASIIGSAASTT